jgi:hypothetical protein
MRTQLLPQCREFERGAATIPGTGAQLLVVTIVLLVGAAAALIGDPTEDTFAVTLLNNTQHVLVANQCGYGCGSKPTETDKLNPRESVAVNTSSSHSDNWWQITTLTGAVAGCVNLLYDQKEAHALRRLSVLTGCPRS